MTAPDYAALIERLTRKNEDGTLCEITEADQQAAADAIERLTQPGVEVEPVGKVVDNGTRGTTTFIRCDGVAILAYGANVFDAATVAWLIAERDTLQEQVKTLRDALKAAKANAGNPESVYLITKEALAATEQKGKP